MSSAFTCDTYSDAYPHANTHRHTHTHTNRHTHTHTHTHRHTHTHTHRHTYTDANAHTYTYTYSNTYTRHSFDCVRYISGIEYRRYCDRRRWRRAYRIYDSVGNSGRLQ